MDQPFPKFWAETTSPMFGAVVATARVWSRTDFCLPLDVAHEAQFFQKPIVSARPPGGGVLSTLNVRVWPTATEKFVHTVILLTFGLGSVGVLMLLGTNKGLSPDKFVFQPGITCSQIW